MSDEKNKSLQIAIARIKAQGAAEERARIINLVKQLHDDAISYGDMIQTAKAYAYEYLVGLLKDGEPMSNNPTCIDCAYYATKKDVDLIAQRERARIRAAVEEALVTTEKAIATTKDDYFYGYREGLKAMLKFLKDGEADAGR